CCRFQQRSWKLRSLAGWKPTATMHAGIVSIIVARFQAAEQSMAFLIRPRREVQRAGNSRPPAVAERDRPQAIDHHRPAPRALQQSAELAVDVEGHDRAAAEVADEQFIGVLAERARRERHAPR